MVAPGGLFPLSVCVQKKPVFFEISFLRSLLLLVFLLWLLLVVVVVVVVARFSFAFFFFFLLSEHPRNAAIPLSDLFGFVLLLLFLFTAVFFLFLVDSELTKNLTVSRVCCL